MSFTNFQVVFLSGGIKVKVFFISYLEHFNTQTMRPFLHGSAVLFYSPPFSSVVASLSQVSIIIYTTCKEGNFSD